MKLNPRTQYTRAEAAELLGVNTKTVWNYIQAGLLPAIIIKNRYLIKGSDIQYLLQHGTQQRRKWRPRPAKTAEGTTDPAH